jgi:hypothetical protein
MIDEEKMLRAKFYLAPASVSFEQLKEMNAKFTAYPGLTKDQANELYDNLQKFKESLDKDNVAVWINGVKKVK